ncbi:putative RNA recognition motif protein [Toxoplasma gondii TgCatPRC2]|uniref:RNA recognition motif protein n=4 Tax=Toxoplasma gondii TaxID=5811 RepID=A0A125YH85_TOXGV|nr:hypothetical protein TGME49_274140 [Toxoplasma gondii ME49]EPT28721.1 hypothetical protein TGME49_274140 [Toxoplasma gondii ME49]ESS36065.1 putative RNA recognition motif protein [Toxoplasma gondii VEG]KYF46380.1 putative RNA recognition motif protein [Toxoplasma gondii ARI]KYK71424.1 putative RNA recognition motif protein [Toxoplasma gondii TgCatPRC2]|eukprot:XP_018636754.1 hypothetical protein TGME49_274140 [Toxoplasma gondii ME49]
MHASFMFRYSAKSCGSSREDAVLEEREPELAMSSSSCHVQSTCIQAASMTTQANRRKTFTMKNNSDYNGASSGADANSGVSIQCPDDKELLETAELRNPLSAQSTNSFAGDSYPFSPAANHSFHSEGSLSAAQSSVMSLSSTSFTSITSATCYEEKESNEVHRTAESSSAEHTSESQLAQILQRRQSEECRGNGANAPQLCLPEARSTIPTIGDRFLRLTQNVHKAGAPSPASFASSFNQGQELLSLLTRKNQEQARTTALGHDKEDTSGGTSSHNDFMILQGTDSHAERNIFVRGNTETVRPSPAVRYEDKEFIVSEFSRLWKGNKCLEPQEVPDSSGGQTQDSRTHISSSVTAIERGSASMVSRRDSPNRHAIVLDEDSMFKDLATAWDIDVTEESAAERHGRAAREKQQSVSFFENRCDTGQHAVSRILHMAANSSDECTIPNVVGINAPPEDAGIPEFIGRRWTFPGGEVGKMDLTEAGKYFPCVVGPTGNQGINYQRRYSGPFALPAVPSDDMLEARDLWSWDGTDSCTPGMPAVPFVEGSCSQRSFYPPGDLSGEQAATRPTDLNTAGKHDTSTSSGRSGGLAKYTLIVNVPPMTTRQDLHMTFSAFGKVELTVVVCDKDHRHPHKEWTATSEYFGDTGNWQPGTPFVPVQSHQTMPPLPEEPRRINGVSPGVPTRQPPGMGNLEQRKVPVGACVTPQSAQDFACRVCRKFIAFDPVLLPCWHLCCSDCVHQCLRWQPNHPSEPVVVDCPECGSVWQASAIKKIDEADSGLLLRLRQLKDNERVCCPFAPLCRWTGRANTFVSHTYSHMMAEGGLFDDNGHGKNGPNLRDQNQA